MIYIIIYKTSESLGCCTVSDKDVIFISTNKDKAQKVMNDYRELGPSNCYDYEIFELYECPEMNTINYPFQEIGTIIDKISYE